MMYFIIAAVHVLFVISIVLLVIALIEKREKEKKPDTIEKTEHVTQERIEAHPVTQPEKPEQLIHTALSNILRNFVTVISTSATRSQSASEQKTAFGNDPLSSIYSEPLLDVASGSSVNLSGTEQLCPSCSAPWDDAFDFCLKCGQTAAK